MVEASGCCGHIMSVMFRQRRTAASANGSPAWRQTDQSGESSGPRLHSDIHLHPMKFFALLLLFVEVTKEQK